MSRYLISFPDGSMDHITDDELPEVDAAAHRVVREAKEAGVWVHGGGLMRDVRVSVVAVDGGVRDAKIPLPVGGFCIVDVASREDALSWAARTAAACRCPQEVRELMDDPQA